jgi:3-oxoacyl-[acyl-carrier-protein] synthase-3
VIKVHTQKKGLFVRILEPNLPLKMISTNTHVGGKRYSNLDIINLNPACQKLTEKAKESLSNRIIKEYGIEYRYMNRAPGITVDTLKDEVLGEDLASKSVIDCFNESDESHVDFFVHGTTTPSRFTGIESTHILSQINQFCPYVEMKAGCSTSLASMYTGIMGLLAGHENVMINCSETMSKVLNPDVPETWFGGGDGSATLWLKKEMEENSDFKVKAMVYGSDGRHVNTYTTHGSLPPNKEDIDNGDYTLKGDGVALFANSLEYYVKMLTELDKKIDLTTIDYIIPHQVNLKLIVTLMKKYPKIENAKLIMDAREIGNIGGSSILYSLAKASKENTFEKGSKVLMMSVGGGLSYCAQIWEKL